MLLLTLFYVLLITHDWCCLVNAKLKYNYDNFTLDRVIPFVDKSFINKIFPDYPCLFVHTQPDSYTYSLVLNKIYQQRSLDMTLINTNVIRATSTCRGLIVVSNSMHLSVGYIMKNKPFHKHMRIYILLIKHWSHYLFFQEHWENQLLDLEVMVAIVFPFPKKIHLYALQAYSSQFRMVAAQQKKNYFSSFQALSTPTFNNHKGRQITISTFKYQLFNTLDSLNTSSVTPIKNFGIEEFIFLQIAHHLNLTWKILIPSGENKWGTLYPNQTISGGIFLDLYKGDADMGFAALWYDFKKLNYFDMSVPWSAVCPKFLFPKYQKIQSNWRNLLEPFTWKIWMALFFSIVLQTCILKVFSRCALRMKIITFKHYLSTMNSFMDIIRILLTAGSVANKRMSSLGPLRHLISWWFVFSLVLTSIYSSNYYSHLTSPEYTPKIEGIQQLLELKYKWGSTYPPPHSWIFNTPDEVHLEYGKLYQIESSIEDRISHLQRGNYAAYCTNVNNLFFMDVDEIPSDILSDLRSFRTCLAHLFVAFGFRRGLSFQEQVNAIILRLTQSGIIDYWLVRVVERHYKRNPFSNVYEYKPQSNANNHEPLTLSSLGGAFYLYLLGISISSVVLFLEIRHKVRRQNKKKRLKVTPSFRGQPVMVISPHSSYSFINTFIRK